MSYFTTPSINFRGVRIYKPDSKQTSYSILFYKIHQLGRILFSFFFLLQYFPDNIKLVVSGPMLFLLTPLSQVQHISAIVKSLQDFKPICNSLYFFPCLFFNALYLIFITFGARLRRLEKYFLFFCFSFVFNNCNIQFSGCFLFISSKNNPNCCTFILLHCTIVLANIIKAVNMILMYCVYCQGPGESWFIFLYSAWYLYSCKNGSKS